MLKIYDKNSINEKEEQLFLKLTYTESDINLDVVNNKGINIENSTILTINNNIKGIIISRNINEEIPLKTSLFSNYVLIIYESEINKQINEVIESQYQKEFIKKMEDKDRENISKH